MKDLIEYINEAKSPKSLDELKLEIIDLFTDIIDIDKDYGKYDFGRDKGKDKLQKHTTHIYANDIPELKPRYQKIMSYYKKFPENFSGCDDITWDGRPLKDGEARILLVQRQLVSLLFIEGGKAYQKYISYNNYEGHSYSVQRFNDVYRHLSWTGRAKADPSKVQKYIKCDINDVKKGFTDAELKFLKAK